jgi:CRP-like cAMP-binding protein
MPDLDTPFSETMAVLCADQMQCWETGDHVQAEHYLQRFPELHNNRDAILDLLYQEIYLRQLYDDPLGEEELVERFPYLADDITTLLEIHAAIDQSSPTHVLQHFDDKIPSEEIVSILETQEEYPHSQVFAQTFPFSELPPELRKQLAEVSSERVLSAGDLLVRQGDPTESLILLVEGTIQVNVDDENDNNHVLNTLSPPALIGEIGIFTGQPRTAHVVAIDAVRVLEIHVDQFLEIARQFPAINSLISQQVALRIGTADRDVLCGKTIRGFQIKRRCGRGSMGVVYEAREVDQDEYVALKMMRHDLVYNPEAMHRFQREADILKQIDHPHCVKLLDNFPALNTIFLVLEYCDGPSLASIIKSDAPLPIEKTRRITSQLASALAHAHRLGIIHRDIKPANVLLSKEGMVKLADFGLARDLISSVLTSVGQIVGTPRYMADEQLTGGAIDSRTDVYALGCTVYEMITGHPLFTANDLLSLLRQKATWSMSELDELEASVPADLYQLLQQSLSPDPQERTLDLDLVASWTDPTP